MRTNLIESAKGLKVRGIAGTYVVLLAFNCSKAYRKGILGFGIERRDHTNGESTWLRGLRKFDLPASDEGADVTTRRHPIQKFHWGDYTTKPSRKYTYTIHTFKGVPSALSNFDSVSLDVTCENPDAIGVNHHAVHFNRSVAASQAFTRRFPDLPAGEVVDENARRWLSRGLAEALIAFIDAAKAGEGLHLFVYEFEKDEFLEALRRAKARGVRLEILFDAILNGGKGPSLKSKKQIKKFGLSTFCKGRDGAGINISHNKFMVLTGTNGEPKSVWSGSTNWTDNGIYGQSNVGHGIRDAALARTYFDWHQKIWNAPKTSAGDSRAEAMALTPLPSGALPATSLALSPRKTIEAVTECAGLVNAAHKMVCFTAPFEMHDSLEAALTAAPAQVCGLLNNHGVVGQSLHKAPNTLLAAAGALDQKSILDRWQGQLHKESMHHSGVFIHTKILLIDPLSDNPIVITGSANFSTNSCTKNDENQLFIAGELEVADVYLGEFMRMFDHYYFRDYMKRIAKEKKSDLKAGFLKDTDVWTDDFFDGKAKEAVRVAFF